MGRAPQLREHYLKLLDEAARLPSGNPVVLAALGRRALLGTKPEAVELLQAAISAGSTDSTTYLDLGEALSRRGDLDGAIAVLRRGADLEPFSKELRKSLILRYIAAKQYDSARTSMKEYLDVFPEDSFLRRLLSSVQPTTPAP
jgi:tetratricopeptide (TPR) repeat protein